MVALSTSAGTPIVTTPKVALAPDALKQMAMQIEPRLPATWDEAGHQWRIVAGRYDVILGGSSRDIAQKVRIRLPEGVLPVR
ncbi:fibronectin type III-like domain-contianing protein [Sphingomonas sp. QA11]|uniref:fibronectin type III-like domain-contianing protein n=1 Tax=Sphingomonas sp. QA11 TaxID=2950605 RepID=UPI0023491DCA|nr:fibronectin type III-like domain-contianing protein [Sphingomonas sp. QA11]WCM29028.1 fibronectin type III-like domain-contianing protein [Sphingomonas sp. QA11]